MNIPKLTTIYVVRHGQSIGNATHDISKDVIPENAWGTDLSELGISQAQALAIELKGLKFDAIFSSDLLRATHTAEIIALEHQLIVVTNATIRESNAQSFYHYDHTKREEMKRLIDELEEEKKMSFRGDEKMETYEEAAQRLGTFLREVAIAYEGGQVLIVAHGTLIRAFLIMLGFAAYNELPSGSIENTGYFVVESDGIEFFLKETHGVHRQ